MRFLQSTFSDAQWAQAGSEEGIGAGDMTEIQREVYLSMLPEPFVVAPLNPSEQAGRPAPLAPDVTLSSEQRAATRLQMQKRLIWGFQQQDADELMPSHSVDFRIVEFGYTYRLAVNTSLRDKNDGLGVDLRYTAPNRPKPSQLPSDWAALDRPITLDTAESVGDLVEQIGRQTGAHLYCDPRYSARTVLLLGRSAQAIDILQALCAALTATWRRLGDTFVLTDDLAGLGARQAQIEEWIQQRVLLTDLIAARVDKILAEKAYAALNWSDSDPLRPNADLVGKLDAFLAQPPAASPGLGSTSQSPHIPLADLPAAAREQFQTEFDQRFKAAPRYRVRPDSVSLGARVQASYVVPGVGRMAASEIPDFFGFTDIVSKPYLPYPIERLDGDFDIPALFAAVPQRALLIDPREVSDLTKFAGEARDRGFSQLWIVVPPGGTKLIAAAVRAGKEKRLAVHAVTRIMRADPKAATEALDRNILGETATQYVHRRIEQAQGILAKLARPGHKPVDSSELPSPAWAHDKTAATYLRRGDFRQNTEAARLEIRSNVGSIAATPNLAGIVFDDMAAPGFESFPSETERSVYNDPLLQMGYDDATRLACLTKLGFDPIDVSPFSSGDEALDIALPFFRDYARNSFPLTPYDRYVAAPGGSSLWPEWCAFRHELSVATARAALAEVQARRPDLPIKRGHNGDPTSFVVNWYGSLDPSRPDQIGSIKESDASPRPGQGFVPTLDIARAESANNFYAVALGASAHGGRPSTEETLRVLGYGLRASANWEGVVIDLTAASSDAEALDLLKLFPIVPALQ